MSLNNFKTIALLGLTSGLIISNEVQAESLSQDENNPQQKYLLASCGANCGGTPSTDLQKALNLDASELEENSTKDSKEKKKSDKKDLNNQQESDEKNIQPYGQDKVVRYNPRQKAQYYYEYTADAEEFNVKQLDQKFGQTELLSILDEKEKSIYLFKLSPAQQNLVIERMNLKIKPELKFLPVHEYKHQVKKFFYLSLPSEIISQLDVD